MATFNTTDLEFILTQIKMAENNQPPVSPHLAFGLRQVAGTSNNTVPGQGTFGSADQTFPTMTDQFFQTVTVNVDGTPFDPNPGVAGDTLTTTYASTVPGAPQVFGVNVVDPAPRLISNAISDISSNNPAAAQTAQAFGAQLGDGYTVLNTNPKGLALTLGVDGVAGTADDFWGADGIAGTADDVDARNLFIGNITPDNGLSAPFNNWMTFFGQFFDHGLDLITKGGAGTVFIPLAADDPLLTLGPDGLVDGSVLPDGSIAPNDKVPASNAFMVLTRATNENVFAGADGVLGTADDIHQHINTTTPFVDQNQTYTSNPAHQAFLREYITGADGKLHSTGRLLTHAAGPDNIAGNADDNSGMATWADVKANALNLGIILTDADVGDVPLVATDAYGNLLLTSGNANPALNGRVQFVTNGGLTLTPAGTQASPVHVPTDVVHTGHAFINDMAQGAGPAFLANPGADGVAHTWDDLNPAGYNGALLNSHYIAGDGRVNENIVLTTVHEIFHDEHNRLIAQTQALIQQELNNGNVSFAANWVTLAPGAVLTTGHVIAANEWNGERLFQAAKFGTETQYQHLVFEEFARKIAPNIHVFGNVNIALDPAITSEFANAVYRFGHSMLDENVPIFKLNPDGTPQIGANGQPVFDSNMGLIQAFTNPLAYASLGKSGAAEIVQGTTHQIGSEIDEFVTGSLRNNLLGLPLDLAALNIARGRDTGVAPINLVRAQLYDSTHDDSLKPYANWDEFRQFLKHDASIINFLAAYGTHSSITGAVSLADKRIAAIDLVTMGTNPGTVAVPLSAQQQDAYDFMHSVGVYHNDIANALAVHGTWSTGSITGVDNVDLWIGGLAEKQNLFGGLLGSTFNAIFETQMESLQDGDRLYYLPRIEGTHWSGEIEGNTFADLIMRNTGAAHLPASIFLTPEYTVEARDYLDASGNPTDSAGWLHNPVTGNLLVEVLPDKTIHFIGDDNFFGNTMVLGGTAGDDRLMAGNADDDTVWGDGGNDWIDGGNGNDQLFGGDGNDTIVDDAGDDIIHGDAGNDTIQAGRGDDIVFGGDGNDYIEMGDSGPAGAESAVGGLGNDIIVGGDGADELEGNEGDDWIEGGTAGDVLVGDVGAPTGQVPLYGGNDVIIGGEGGGDVMKGFSGDDIMLGQNGFDKFQGRLGFDWASWEQNSHGVDVDMNRREFIPNPGAPAGDAVRDFFVETEAASGSNFDDFILGTNVSKADTFNELTNTSLIFGLDDYFDPLAGPVAFSGGNILFGAGGSDALTGGGGNDILDGDARVHVELIGGHHAGAQILREILYDQNVGPTFDPVTGAQLTAGDIDTAVFSDVAANYTISVALDAAGFARVDSHGNAVIQVTHNTVAVGATNDGTDLLFNMERVQFSDVQLDLANPGLGLFGVLADGTVVGVPFTDAAPTGILTLLDSPFVAAGTPNGPFGAVGAATPVTSGDVLKVNATDAAGLISEITDFDGALLANGTIDPATIGFFGGNIPIADLHLQWQALDVAGKDWFNIAGANSTSFTVTDFQIGNQLRLEISYTDGLHHHEVVTSAPTVVASFPAAPPVNNAPTVVTQVAVPGLPDTQAKEDTAFGTVAHPGIPLDLIHIFTDDTTPANLLTYSATLAGTLDGVNVDGNALASIGLSLAFIPDPATQGAILGARLLGTPPANFSGPMDIRVTATDAGGLSVQDTFTINVLPVDDGVSALSIVDNVTLLAATVPRVGEVLLASLGPDPDSTALHPSGPAAFQWMRDGANIVGATAATFTPGTTDIGHVLTVKAVYTDGQGFLDTSLSAATGKVVDPTTPAPPTASPIVANIVEDAAFTPVNLLDPAFVNDPNGDAVFLKAGSVSVTVPGTSPDGGARVLTSAGATPDFTVSAAGVFDLTAAGLAKFNSLAAGVVDAFTVNYAVTDNLTEVPNFTANTLTINVTGVNDAPVLTAAPLHAAATEGGAIVNASALTNATDPDIGNILHAVPGALPAGVTFTAATDTFSFDPTNAAYNSLKAGATQAVTVNYAVSDGTLSVADSVVFDVTGTNDAPTAINLVAATATVSGTAAPASGATIATFSAVDPDIGDSQNFSLTGAANGFTITGAGVLAHTGALATGSLQITVRDTDGGTPGVPGSGLTVDKVVVVQTGSTGNDAGLAALNGTANTDIIYGLAGNDTINGNGGDDTLFGQNNSDNLIGGAGNDTLYGGTGADNFGVSTGNFGADIIGDFTVNTDRIAVNAIGITAANLAVSLTNGAITRASDGAGGTLITFNIGGNTGSFDLKNVTTAQVTTAINNGNLFNTAPTGLSFANNNYKVFENAAGAIIDGIVVHDDAGDTHTFQVSDSRFEVVDGDLVTPGEQLVLKLKDGISLDYETEKTIALDISVFDSANQGSLLNPYHFTLQTQNVNEAPINIQPSNASVNENAADGTVIANLTATDPDGNPVTFSLSNSADDRFVVVNNQLRVAHGVLLDYEQTHSHTVTVVATDNGGLSTSQTLVVNLNNLAEAVTIQGTANFDALTGTSGADRIAGLGGDDFIVANAGNDYIDGGAGADTMNGGSGNDTYVVDNAGDVVVDNGGGIDTVRTSLASYSLAGTNIENLINTGSADPFTGTGSSVANIMRGAAQRDVLSGLGGNDLLIGGGGNDKLDGGTGNDTLFGGAGNDQLIGGAGRDTLSGGAGNDQFVFNTTLGGNNIDTITDFTVPGDSIRLDHTVFSALAVGGLSAADFVIGAAAQDASDKIIYNSLTGTLSYDSNGSAAGGAVQFAQLDKGLLLTNADFIIF